MKKLPDEDSVLDEMLAFKVNSSLTHESVLKMLDERGTNNSSNGKDTTMNKDNDDLFSLPMDTPKSNSKAKKMPEVKSSIPAATTRGRGRGGRGRGARGGGTTRSMPELDVTISSVLIINMLKDNKLNIFLNFQRGNTRQQSLLDALGQKNSSSITRRGTNKAPVYEISDDSD